MGNAQDIVGIKYGHTRTISGNESSALRTRCNRDADIWRIQRGRGLCADTYMDWLRTVFGLDAVADWPRPADQSMARKYCDKTATSSRTAKPYPDKG
jgi:hypothetical protein